MRSRRSSSSSCHSWGATCPCFAPPGVRWGALRRAPLPLAAFAGVLHAVSSILFVVLAVMGGDMRVLRPAFGHLGFWTPVVLGLTALLAGGWLRDQAPPPAGQPIALAPPTPGVPGVPVIWGRGWWLFGMRGESVRVLTLHALASHMPAAVMAVVLVTSVLSALVAHRRDWPQ